MRVCLVFSPFSSFSYIPLGISYIRNISKVCAFYPPSSEHYGRKAVDEKGRIKLEPVIKRKQCMRLIFVVTLIFVLVCCPVSMVFSQHKYELSNIKVELVKTGSIGDITKYKNFDLGTSEVGRDKGFEEFAIKLLEARGFKNVEHKAAQISFVYILYSTVTDDSTVPLIKEGYQKGDIVLWVVLVAHDKETVATGYKDADARSWGATASATVTPPLPSPTLDNEEEEGKILLALYKKLLAQLIDKCIPGSR